MKIKVNEIYLENYLQNIMINVLHSNSMELINIQLSLVSVSSARFFAYASSAVSSESSYEKFCQNSPTMR